MTVHAVERRRFLLSLFGITLIIALSFPLVTYASTANGTVQDCIGQNKDCTGDTKDHLQQEPAADKLPTEDSDESAAGMTTSVWDYIKVFFSLAFVLGLLLFILRFLNKRNRKYETSRLMHNLGGLSLGQQKSIQLVKIGERYYVVGVGTDVSLLKEITDEDEIERLLQFYNEQPDMSTGGLFEWIRNRFSKQQTSKLNEREGNSTEFSSMFQSKIDEIQAERKRQISRLIEKERDRNE